MALNEFAPIGALFALAALVAFIVVVISWIFGPHRPTTRKAAPYESGMKPIGPAKRRMPVKFYLVAVLFIIFDVEVAFFFPWASVYGSTMQLADTQLSDSARTELSARLLSIDPATISPAQVIDAQTALQLGWVGLADILVFFGVLLVGFAYVWKRGDLNWIRAVSKTSTQAADQTVASARG